MPTTTRGVVRNGFVIPNQTLPEGAQVEISLCEAGADVPPELQAELEAWQRANANALELVERLAQENAGDEKR